MLSIFMLSFYSTSLSIAIHVHFADAFLLFAYMEQYIIDNVHTHRLDAIIGKLDF